MGPKYNAVISGVPYDKSERAIDKGETTMSAGRIIRTNCPECNHNTLDVTVEGCGIAPNPDGPGNISWFDGEGRCTNPDCGYTGYYNDQGNL